MGKGKVKVCRWGNGSVVDGERAGGRRGRKMEAMEH